MKKTIILTAIFICSLISEINGQQPKTAEEFYQRGMIQASKGVKQQAVEDFTAAIKLDPKHIPSYLGRAEMFILRDRGDLAIADFTTAINLDPNSPDGYVGRGILYREQGETRLAIEDFNQIIRIAPKSAWGYINRGRAFDDLIKDAEAEADFATALRLEPENPQAYFYRGFMSYKRHRFEAAIYDMTMFLELEDSDRQQMSEANIIRSMAYLEKGDRQAALECANEAIRFFPSSAKVYYARAKVYQTMNKKKRALADTRKAKQLAK